MVEALARRYDPATAADWDAVGLVCGDPGTVVRRVLFAVDPAPAVVAEALQVKADLLVTHHPLFLRPVHGVPADDPKGALVHRLITGGCALYVAHTNADVAAPGVSDALAAVLGLQDTAPLVPGRDSGTGLGRIGVLGAPMRLREFAAAVAVALPATAGGLRVAGDLEAVIHRVAVCGGSGGDLIGAAGAAGAEVLVTSDLTHHVGSDGRDRGGPALVDVAHWAGEWPWLAQAADLLVSDLAAGRDTVGVTVSDLVTDPWTARV